MASPYFQQINVNKPDFTPIVRGAEAYGRGIGAAAEALGKLGGAYFQRKAVEKSAKDFLMSPAGPDYLKTHHGWDDEMIADIQNDPKKAEKLVFDGMREGGGVQKFKEYLADVQRQQQQTEMFNMQTQQFKQTQKQLKMQTLQMQDNEESRKRTQGLYKFLYTKDDDGNIGISPSNLIANIPEGSEKEAYELLDAMGMNNLNIAGFLDTMRGQDPDMFSRPEEMTSQVVRALSMHPKMSVEDQKKTLDIVNEQIIKPSDITKTATDYWDTDPMNKQRIDVIESAGALKTNIKTAIGEDADGKFYIANAPAAGTAMRNFARVANGAGVMTDKDVDSVGGPSNYNAWWNRFTTKFMGSVERDATEEDVKLGYADRVGEKVTINAGARVTPEDLIMMRDATTAIERLNNKRLQEAGVKTQEHLQSTYGTLSNERLLELNPYAEYFHDAYKIDILDEQWPMMQSMRQREGDEKLKEVLLKYNPRMTDGAFDNILNRLDQMNLPGDSDAQKQPPNLTPSTMDGNQTQPVNPDANQTQPIDPGAQGNADPAPLDPEANKTSSRGRDLRNAALGTVAEGVGYGLPTTLGWMGIYAGGDVVNKGVGTVKNIATTPRLTKAADRLLPQKIKAELKKNPKAMFEKYGGKHGPLGSVAKKMGVEKIDQLTTETLEKQVKLKIKNEMREKIAARGGKTAMAKLAKLFRPSNLAKKLIPGAGFALASDDFATVMDIVLDEVSTPSKVEKLEKAMKTTEQEMLKAGTNPVEILLTAQVFEELIKEAQAGLGRAPTIIEQQDPYMDSSSTGVLKQNLGDYFK